MKFLLAVITFSFTTAAWSACAPVDRNKVIFFIDTNNSSGEIEAARRGACARGERLVVAPRDYREHEVPVRAYIAAETIYRRECGLQYPPNNTQACRTSSAAFDVQKANYNRFKESRNFDLGRSVHQELAELKAQGAKITNMTLSGHDGGGIFAGAKGEFQNHEIQEIINQYPEVNGIQSLSLLGCKTTVQMEVQEWKAAFPDLRVIGGYDDSAPLSDRPLGHQYYEDLLKMEPRLVAQADQSRLQSFARNNIRGLSQMNTGIYVQLACEDEFYYGANAPDAARQFAEYGDNERRRQCAAARPRLMQLANQYAMFMDGRLEPRSSAPSPELDAMDDQTRLFQDCLEMDQTIPLNASNVFNLRFYGPVKQNFTNFFSEDLAIAAELLAGIPGIWVPNAANLGSKSRAELMRNLNAMHSLLAGQGLTDNQRRALTWTKNVTQRHLQNFQNPFSWHEYNGETDEPDEVERLTRNP